MVQPGSLCGVWREPGGLRTYMPGPKSPCSSENTPSSTRNSSPPPWVCGSKRLFGAKRTMLVARATSPPSRSSMRRCTPGSGESTHGSSSLCTTARWLRSALIFMTVLRPWLGPLALTWARPSCAQEARTTRGLGEHRSRHDLTAGIAEEKRMRSLVPITVVVVAASLLAACAGQSTIYNDLISGAYRPYEYGYGAGRRDLTTIVVGNPFDVDQAELETRLVAMLNESPTFLQPTNFTTTPGPSARPQYRAVVLFNRQIVLPSAACRAPER